MDLKNKKGKIIFKSCKIRIEKIITIKEVVNFELSSYCVKLRLLYQSYIFYIRCHNKMVK